MPTFSPTIAFVAISLFTRMPRSGGPGEACFGCAVGFPRAGTHGHRFAEPEAAASEPRNYSGAAAPRFRGRPPRFVPSHLVRGEPVSGSLTLEETDRMNSD